MTQETYAMAAIVHRAKIQVSRLQSSQAGVRNALLCDIQSADDVSLENITATWDPLLEKLEIFSKLARTVSEVNIHFFCLITFTFAHLFPVRFALMPPRHTIC